MATQMDKAQRFRALHERPGAFVIPNPWDAGSARMLAGMGFEALASTSAGFANANLENCFADDPKQAAQTIVLAAQAGVAENFLRGRPDLDDTIRRLQAFEAAGADVLYAPGLTTLDQVRAVTSAVSKPVNVLAVMIKGATVAQLAQAGAKRLSVGGALARVAVTALLRAAAQLRDEGSFGWVAGLTPTGEVNHLLSAGAARND